MIHLKPTGTALARIEELRVGSTRHRFTSLRLWEQSAEPLLADPALLPLAVLARSADGPPEQLLGQVRQRLQAISNPDQRRRVTSGCQLLAGLAFPQDVIQRLLAMSILEDSSVYQYIVRQGREEGLETGRQLEAASLLLRQLEHRFGPLNQQQRNTLAALPLERLEDLGLAVLDFQGPADLAAWLG